MSIYTQCFIGYSCCLIIGVIGLEFYRQDRREQLDKTLFIIFGLLAVGFVIFRPIGIVTDDYGYVPKFEAICPLSDCAEMVQSSRDYLWYTLVAFGKSFSDSPRVMLALSGATLTLKLLIVYLLTTQKALALLAYISIFYLTHDVIAFRVSASESVYLFSLYCIAQRWTYAGIATNVLSGLIHAQGLVAPLALIGTWLRPRRVWLNLMVLAPLVFLGLGLYPKFDYLRTLAETHGSEDGWWVWHKLTAFLKGDRQPTRLVPLVVPPVLLFTVYMYNHLIPRKTKVIKQAYFSVGLSSILLWFVGYNTIFQLRFFYFFFLPVILLIGNIKKSRIGYYAAISLSTMFMLKYNVLHELFFEYRTLYIEPADGGNITGYDFAISCGKNCYKVSKGTVLWLTANPDKSHHFIAWESSCGRYQTHPRCRIIMNDDYHAKAIFKKPYELGLVPSEHGRVWTYRGPIDCGESCEAFLDPGDTIILNAWPKPGYYLADWKGPCEDTALIDCKFTSNQKTTIEAKFEPIKMHLVIVDPPEQSRIISEPLGIDCGKEADDCFGLFDHVNLRVELGNGNAFVSWSGCEPSNRLTCKPRTSTDRVISLAVNSVVENEVIYLGQDADWTGKENEPDGSKDTHLQILHTFSSGEALLEVQSTWIKGSGDPDARNITWSSSGKYWGIKVFANNAPLVIDSSNRHINSKMEGKVRLDIYVPFYHEMHAANGSVYALKLRIIDGYGVERIMSADIMVN